MSSKDAGEKRSVSGAERKTDRSHNSNRIQEGAQRRTPASGGGSMPPSTAAFRPVDADAAAQRARRGAHARKPGIDAGGSTVVMPVDTSRRASDRRRRRPDAFQGSGEPSGNRADFAVPRKSRVGKALAITLGAIALLLAVVYVAGAVAFTGRFYPNTTMGTLDLSLKSADEAAALLADAERDYTLHVEGQGLDFDITSKQAGLGVDARAIVEAALADSDPWKWPLRIAGGHDETAHMIAASDTESLSEAVRGKVDAYNESAKPSADAYVGFDEEQGAYTVHEEVYGEQVSADAVIDAAAKAIASMQESVELGEDVLIEPSLLSDDGALAAAAEKANVMIGCDVVLKSATDGTQMAELDGSVISQWITFDEAMQPTLDSAALDAWANELASSFNTVGTTRSYTRPDGKHVEIGGGDYGWMVDSEALISAVQEAVNNGTVGDLSIPCSSTGNGFTAAGQDWGAYCDIDLTEQHAYYYDASGALLWDAPVVTGKPNGEDDTPTGVYYLKNLKKDDWLKGPIDPDTGENEWLSHVDYWMPFIGNLVGLHDAPWQPASVFGNAEAYKTYGSHGCVNLSVDKAAALFDVIKIGDPVIVHW